MLSLRPLGLIVCVAFLSAACSAGDGSGGGQAAGSPSAVASARIASPAVAPPMASLWTTTGSSGSYKDWTEYRIGPRNRVAGHCLPEWLPNYDSLEKVWLASLAGG